MRKAKGVLDHVPISALSREEVEKRRCQWRVAQRRRRERSRRVTEAASLAPPCLDGSGEFGDAGMYMLVPFWAATHPPLASARRRTVTDRYNIRISYLADAFIQSNLQLISLTWLCEGAPCWATRGGDQLGRAGGKGGETEERSASDLTDGAVPTRKWHQRMWQEV